MLNTKDKVCLRTEEISTLQQITVQCIQYYDYITIRFNLVNKTVQVYLENLESIIGFYWRYSFSHRSILKTNQQNHLTY